MSTASNPDDNQSEPTNQSKFGSDHIDISNLLKDSSRRVSLHLNEEKTFMFGRHYERQIIESFKLKRNSEFSLRDGSESGSINDLPSCHVGNEMKGYGCGVQTPVCIYGQNTIDLDAKIDYRSCAYVYEPLCKCSPNNWLLNMYECDIASSRVTFKVHDVSDKKQVSMINLNIGRCVFSKTWLVQNLGILMLILIVLAMILRKQLKRNDARLVNQGGAGFDRNNRPLAVKESSSTLLRRRLFGWEK